MTGQAAETCGYQLTDKGQRALAGMDNDWYPVDSQTFPLPGGGTVIGRDAYEAEMTRRVFRRFDGEPAR